MFLSIRSLFFDFKKRVMLLRKGDYSHLIVDPEEFELDGHTEFLGQFISGVAVSFLIMWFLLAILEAVLFLKIFWTTLWDMKWTLLILMAAPIIMSIAKGIAKGKIITTDSILRRRIWSIFEL